MEKGISGLEQRKNKLHHLNPHTWISLGTKFHFKEKILNFGTKFAQKEQMNKKMNITPEVFVYVPNFSLNGQF